VFVTSRSSFSRSRKLSEWSSIIEEVLIHGSGITERKAGIATLDQYQTVRRLLSDLFTRDHIDTLARRFVT